MSDKTPDEVTEDDILEVNEAVKAEQADEPFVQLVEPAPNDEDRNQGVVPTNDVPDDDAEPGDKGVLDPDRMNSLKDPNFGLDQHRSTWDTSYGRPAAEEIWGQDGHKGEVED